MARKNGLSLDWQKETPAVRVHFHTHSWQRWNGGEAHAAEVTLSASTWEERTDDTQEFTNTLSYRDLLPEICGLSVCCERHADETSWSRRIQSGAHSSKPAILRSAADGLEACQVTLALTLLHPSQSLVAFARFIGASRVELFIRSEREDQAIQRFGDPDDAAEALRLLLADWEQQAVRAALKAELLAELREQGLLKEEAAV